MGYVFKRYQLFFAYVYGCTFIFPTSSKPDLCFPVDSGGPLYPGIVSFFDSALASVDYDRISEFHGMGPPQSPLSYPFRHDLPASSFSFLLPLRFCTFSSPPMPATGSERIPQGFFFMRSCKEGPKCTPDFTLPFVPSPFQPYRTFFSLLSPPASSAIFLPSLCCWSLE